MSQPINTEISMATTGQALDDNRHQGGTLLYTIPMCTTPPGRPPMGPSDQPLHHTASIFLSPSSRLSATSLMLLSQLPRVSTTVSAAILIRRCCTYQPDSTLTFSSAVVSTIPYLFFHHPCYLTSLPHLLCRCIHSPAFMPLPYP